MLHIRLSPSEFTNVKDLVNKGLKIDAIKAVRAAKRYQQTSVDPATGQSKTISLIGLKQAKDAVEHFAGQPIGGPPTAVIANVSPIKSIKVDLGDGNGEAEVDLEGLCFKFSTSINELGIDHVSKLMELYSLLEKWEKSF